MLASENNLVLKNSGEDRRQETSKMAGRQAQAWRGPTCSLSGLTITRYLSHAIATMVREDMKTATHGKTFTIRHMKSTFGRAQDMLNPSTTVRGMERAIMMSDIERLNMKIFLAVLVSLLLQQRLSSYPRV